MVTPSPLTCAFGMSFSLNVTDFVVDGLGWFFCCFAVCFIIFGDLVV